MKKNMRKFLSIMIVLILLVLLGFGYVLFTKYASNHESPKTELKTIEYDGRRYTLPSGWNSFGDYEERGEKLIKISNPSLDCHAIIGLLDMDNEVQVDKETVLTDYTILRDALGADIEEGKVIEHNGESVVTLEFVKDKKLRAYFSAYDNYLYVIRLTSGIFVDGKEEFIYDYDILNTVIDIIKSGKKIK